MRRWKDRSVKQKINLTLLFVAFAPILLVLTQTLRVFEDGFTQKQQQDGRQIIQVVNNVIAEFERHLQEVVALLQQNEILSNAVYYATILGNSQELQTVLDTLSEKLSLELLEVTDLSGKPLAHRIPENAVAPMPIEADALARMQAGTPLLNAVTTEKKSVILRIVAPIQNRGQLVGFIVGGRLINDEFARRLGHLTGGEIVIFQGADVIAASLPAFAAALRPLKLTDRLFSGGAREASGKLIFQNVAHTVCAAPLLERDRDIHAAIAVGLADTEFAAIQTRVKNTVVFVAVALIIGIFILGHVISLLAVRSLKHLTRAVESVAHGDLNCALPALDSDDEFGKLTRAFHLMLSYFATMTETANQISTGNLYQNITPKSPQDFLGNTFQRMSDYLNHVASVTSAIANGDLTVTIPMASAQDIFGKAMQAMTTNLHLIIRQLRASATQIAETEQVITTLTNQAMEIMEAVQASLAHAMQILGQTGASVEEVDQNMLALLTSVETTSNSVMEITATVSRIAVNATELAQNMSQTIQNISQSANMLGKVADEATHAKTLAEDTMQNAMEGHEAVAQVRHSMDMIQQTNLKAVEKITELAKQTQEIGGILKVIYGITDQSSLLALNASIIAAQAGSQGRGFAVVADEMRNLAVGVSRATKDIARIVQTLQAQTAEVVTMIHTGRGHIEEGVSRTGRAQETLEHILESAQRSSTTVTEMANALRTQQTSSQNSLNVLRQAEDMTASFMKATAEQKTVMNLILESIEQILEKASKTQSAANSQMKWVRQTIDATQEMKEQHDRHAQHSQNIRESVTTLDQQARILVELVDRFRLNA